jgi:hypothetical protein
MITHKLDIGGLQFLWSSTNRWLDKNVWYIQRYLKNRDKSLFNSFRISAGKIIVTYYW